ncbi:MAG: hypothetical protein ACXABG_08515, partial [Promethearchaeota archaeon]|jgi:hypothetical protein
MSEKTPKSKFMIYDETVEEEIITEEEKTEGLSEEDIERRKQEAKELKEKKKLESELEKKRRAAHRDLLQQKILGILRKGKVVSKFDLTSLLLKSGIKNYTFRINLIQNSINPEIPLIGNVLKKLRFSEKVHFSIDEGAHVYYTDFDKKTLKPKEFKLDFDWKKYQIPDGNNEIYVAFKVPGSSINPHHLLSSLYPYADFNGFKLKVDKKYENTSSFHIIDDDMDGFFDEDKLILKCQTNDRDTNKSLYRIIQIGRKLIEELIKLNLKKSEVLTIINKKDTMFIPVVPVFRAKDRGAFYETKFTNALRILYDFPQKFESKLIYGRISLISNEIHDEDFEIKSFYKFFDKTFEFQTKSFISTAIMEDWIINPTKALNYLKEDKELKNLIQEYLQDIDTDRIIQEKLEQSMEKSEFLKDITTNLLLTLLGLSMITDWLPFQIVLIVFFIVINLYFFFIKSKRAKKIFSKI